MTREAVIVAGLRTAVGKAKRGTTQNWRSDAMAAAVIRALLARLPARLVVLGSGEKKYEDALRKLAEQAPAKISLSARLDEAMSHLVEAGADFFLMPSLFEPCGLNQMYSQAYGTVPLVSQVGGLVDTVIDAVVPAEAGTGIKV